MNRFIYLPLKEVKPEAQLPLTEPPLVVHSLAVKQVPIITFEGLDKARVHCLKLQKNII